MKIIVFADSHNDVSTMLTIVKSEQPDAILHLGDHIADGLELQENIDIIVYLVKGNTDQNYNGNEELLLTLESKRIYMTHGHLYKVEDSLTALRDAGTRVGAQIVLFGHTHQPFLSYMNGIWFMNPGRIGRKSSKTIHPTYGLICITENRIECEISEVAL